MLLAWIFAWVFPLRRVHRQALLAAPNNGHSLFQEPPYAVRAELWWGPPLKDACPYFCGFSCNAGCTNAFEFDDPTGHFKCQDTFTSAHVACACFAGAALACAGGLAWVRSRFRFTGRSPCRRTDSTTCTNIIGPLLVKPQTARELASCSSAAAEFGIMASTSPADSRQRWDNRVASIAVVQRPLLAHETTPAPLVVPVVHRVTPTRESHRTGGRRENLWLDVHVKTLAGHCLDVRLTRDATPTALKAELHGRWNIPPVNQRIMWGASEMHDHEPMCDQGVFTGSTLHLVMRYQGGGPQGKDEVLFLGTKLGAEKPLPDASESLYAGCYGRFWDYYDNNCGPAAFAVVLEVAYWRAKVSLPTSVPLGKLVMARRESISAHSDFPQDRARAMLEFHRLCVQVTGADRPGVCNDRDGAKPVMRCSTLFEQFSAFVGVSGPAYEAARDTNTSTSGGPFARVLLRPDMLLNEELGSYLSARGGKHPALLAVDVGGVSLDDARFLNVPVKVSAPVLVPNVNGVDFVHAEYRCCGALYCNKRHWKCTVSCPDEYVWEYDSVGQTKLQQVAGWTYAWPRKCKMEASYGPAIFVYVHTPGTGRPLASAVPLSPRDASTWTFRCVREEENKEREKKRKMGAIPYFDAGLQEVANNYGRMAREGRAYLATLSPSVSDSDSNDTEEGSTSAAPFDPSDVFTITSGPDVHGECSVRQGVVSMKVPADSLGEAALTAYESAQAEKNKKAVAAIICAIEAKCSPCSDADMESRVEREFAAVMEEIEGTGSMSESTRVIERHGDAPNEGDGTPTGRVVEALSVTSPHKKRRLLGPPIAGHLATQPAFDYGEATQHVALGRRTWEDVHAGLVLAYRRKGVLCPVDAANVRVVRRVLHTKTGLSMLPGSDPPQHVSLLTEQDGRHGILPPAMHWFNVGDLTEALVLCGVSVGREVVVLDELPMSKQEWADMIGGNGSTVCRYGDRPQWGTVTDEVKGVYRALHETASSAASAARLQMEDPNSEVMCVIAKDLMHWAVLIRPGLKAGTTILNRLGCDQTSDESRAFRELGFVGNCADVCNQGDCGPHCVAVALALLGRQLFVGHVERSKAVLQPNAVPPTPTRVGVTHRSPDLGRRTSEHAQHSGAHDAKGDTVFNFGKYQGYTWREVHSGRLGDRAIRWVRWARDQPKPRGGLKDFVNWINASDPRGDGLDVGAEESSQPASLPSSPCPLPICGGDDTRNGIPPPHAAHMRLAEHPLSVPHAEGTPATNGVHHPFWREFDLTEQLSLARGEPTSVVSAQQFKEGDFALAVDILAPVIREVSGCDHFACMLKPRASPRGWWADNQHWPPTFRAKAMPRFGAIYRCDYHRSAGCPVSLRIMREFGRHPDNSVFSLEISTVPHRHACNHARSFNTKTLGPGVYFPAVHPVVDSFLRAQARANPRIAPSAVMPLLVAHLQNTTHLHCQLCHAEDTSDVAYKAARTNNAPVCFHQSTHKHLAKLPSFLGADRLPGVVHGTSGCTTRDVYVKVHHMVVEDGHAASGTYGMQALNRQQIQRTLCDYKHKYGGAAALNYAMPADGSMKEHYRAFESENLYLYWTNSLLKQNATLYDIYEWRMIALLYTDAKAGQGDIEKPATAAGRLSEADSVSNGAPGMSVDPGHEYVVCYASMASLITSVMAWACREESGGVQIGVDHMYNCVKGCDNVSHHRGMSIVPNQQLVVCVRSEFLFCDPFPLMTPFARFFCLTPAYMTPRACTTPP